MDNKEPLPYLGEPAENVTEVQASDIPADSDHGSFRKPSLVSQCGDDHCGSDSGSQYPLTEYSQSRRCSTVTYASLNFESSRKTSSDSCSSDDRAESLSFDLSIRPDLAPPVTTNYSTRRSMSSLLKKERNWKINTWRWIQTFIITTNC